MMEVLLAVLLAVLFDGKIQIWLQVHNLPLELRDDERSVKFAMKVGKVMSRPKNNEGDELRKFVKFRIEIDLERPITPATWWINPATKKSLTIDFEYEKPPNIFFRCGRFQHETNMWKDESAPKGGLVFGPWLRAENAGVERWITGNNSVPPEMTMEWERSLEIVEKVNGLNEFMATEEITGASGSKRTVVMISKRNVQNEESGGVVMVTLKGMDKENEVFGLTQSIFAFRACSSKKGELVRG